MRGLADVEYTQARLLVPLPAPGKPAPSPEHVPAAQAHLREALRLEPDNPHFVEQFARTHELTALSLDPGDPEARQALRQSAAAFRLAARLRPGSPYVWTDLARVKLRLDDMDFEFYGALDRARRLGPWEPAVQLGLVDMGLAAWPMLATSAQEWVVAALDRALLREEAEVRRIARAHGTLALACEMPYKPPRLTDFCVKK
jgi:cytochrome c-type biogenesis protein CcmH/NrfG